MAAQAYLGAASIAAATAANARGKAVPFASMLGHRPLIFDEERHASAHAVRLVEKARALALTAALTEEERYAIANMLAGATG